MAFFKALALLIIIPIIGFGIAEWVLSDINAEFTAQGMAITISELCTPAIIAQNTDVAQLCSEVNPVFWLKNSSIVSGIAGIALLMSFVIVARSAGQSRTKIAKLFPPLVFFSLFILSILVFVQGAILTYGAYLAETTAIQQVHFYLIGAIGIGALMAGFGLIKSSIKLASKQSMSIMGTTLDREKHSTLFSFISQIAEKLGARSPDNIVVGLDPNFYVTSADVDVIGEDIKLTGETLYLSLPLSRILTEEEIKAVIGHELGHFRGDDTYYSLKFSPVYSGLTHAIDAMENNKSSVLSYITSLPALAVLSYMMDAFHRNVSTISREREFEADRASAEVAEPRALATSLLKIGLYAHAWGDLQNKIVERMQIRKFTTNMSQLFASIVKYDVNEESLPEVIGNISQETVSHPTDSHPPTANRISELGINIDDIEHDLLFMPEQTSVELIPDHMEIEESLTTLQQQYYVSLGVNVPDEEDAEHNYGAIIVAALGAHMVLADGVVEASEIDNAESIGMELSNDFDYVEFREYCYYPDTLPTIDDLVDASTEMEDEGKKLICDYLEKISAADDDVSPEEVALLNKVKAGLGV